jgi:hypothetical protein
MFVRKRMWPVINMAGRIFVVAVSVVYKKRIGWIRVDLSAMIMLKNWST